MARCKAHTKAGKRCKNQAKGDSEYCGVHQGPKKSHIDNQFALGNSGKPKRWASPKDLQNDINAYFKWCDNNPISIHHNSKIDEETGKPIKYEVSRPYTIEGLCSFLECERMTLINYEKEEGYEEYFDTIKAAKNKIQQNKVERGLAGIAPASTTIFDLKNNHGYKDKSEVHNINENTHEFLNDLFPEIREDEH